MSFDVSFQEIFSTLCSGGTLVLIAESLRRDMGSLACFLAEQGIERVFLPFVALQQVAEAMLAQEPGSTSLKEIITAGEQLQATKPIIRLFTQLQECTLHNHYGPSESHVVTAFTLADTPECWPTLPPIGRPIANTQIYLLDAQLNPVPIGVPGELCISGECLARGYLNRPELTAEKFIPNPFSGESGARLYRTGDLVRYLADGSIEFLGRIDDQVKVRGFRVEPGEIEAALCQHPAVQESAVLAREDPPGEKRLVAYVVPYSEQPTPTINELRRFLEEQLPAYMVPSAFVILDALPLTPNGKVDRRALLDAGEAIPAVESEYAPPRTPTEEALAGIWAEILHMDRVGVEDDFFELGGHSLLATRVISQVLNSFHVGVPLRSLFEAPTVAGLAEIIETLISTTGARVQPSVPPLEPTQRDGDLPLSFAQQRLWFLDRLEMNSPAYNIPIALQMSGTLNQGALRQALQSVIDRHESLRTTFGSVDGSPVQVVSKSWTVELPLRDLSELPEANRDEEVASLAAEEARRPFDLARGPLLRHSLLRLGQEEHVLLLTMHHIISDGWSLEVIGRELGIFYEAFSLGQPADLPELPVQYPDFSVWQRQWLRGEVLESQLSYWKGQLEDAPPVLELPADRSRPTVQTYRGASHFLTLPKSLGKSIKALSHREGVTLFMTLLAAFQTLLFRYTGQNAIVVGSPIAGRNRVETEGLIGFFVNTLALRTDLSGDPSFRDLLGRAREVCLGAFDHQDLPFEKLVEELHPERDPSRTPVFQAMMTLQGMASQPFKFQGLNVRQLRVESGISKFDLSLYVADRAEGLECTWEYSTDLFDAETIKRWMGHFQTLLEGIVTDPDQRISNLPLLTEPERRQLLVEWNDTQADYPKDKCIHELFEAQVERTPDAVAVVFEDQRLTYRDLNQRANQLAHHLRGLGVGPEVLVGICMERSLDMMVGLLGILKAGGAYVPLDAEYPKERIAFMLEDAQVSILLTQVCLLPALPEQDAQVICLDTGWDAVAQESEENPASPVASDNLAYVLYTSGSTGKPKGVAIEHHSPVGLVDWAGGVFDAEDLAGVLASTSICFDLSVFELFVPLSWGGTVILVKNALHLRTSSVKGRVTLINTVPSAMAELLREDDLPASVRTVNLAGETLSAQLVQQIYRQKQVKRVFDLYGPSEDTTYSTFTLREEDGPVTIGKPLSNKQVYILDSNLQIVPIGVFGELHIAGNGLARGYHNRPELTAEKFISNPFSDQPGSRLYKTGDLARYLPDGNIEFAGRIDNQVKIRGFRVELGEIEAVLEEHQGVREAIVLAREDNPGDQRLVAYLVPDYDQRPTVGDLRDLLKQKLPEFMVPSAFMNMEVLPLTPNGKVDRRALPKPDQSGLQWDQPFAEPRTPMEVLIAGIWNELLDVEKVGVNDNFFDLGGHSLLSMKVVAQLEKATGLLINPMELMVHTLGQLAAVCGTRMQVAQDQNPIGLTRRLIIAAKSLVSRVSFGTSRTIFKFSGAAPPWLRWLPSRR